jgi:hypothetical protein
MRYPFTATLKKPDKSTIAVDEQGDPVNPTGDPEVSPGFTFPCDYQVSVNTPLFSQNGSFVKISFIIFTTKNLRPKSESGNPQLLPIEKGDLITCEGVSGEVVAIYHGRMNNEIWVK